jgi:hypothetical protein
MVEKYNNESNVTVPNAMELTNPTSALHDAQSWRGSSTKPGSGYDWLLKIQNIARPLRSGLNSTLGKHWNAVWRLRIATPAAVELEECDTCKPYSKRSARTPFIGESVVREKCESRKEGDGPRTERIAVSEGFGPWITTVTWLPCVATNMTVFPTCENA